MGVHPMFGGIPMSGMKTTDFNPFTGLPPKPRMNHKDHPGKRGGVSKQSLIENHKRPPVLRLLQ